MRMISIVAGSISIALVALALAGCGNSTPLPADSAPDAPVSGNYTPSTGAFAAIPDKSSGNAVSVNSCNLDAVNDKPAGSEPLARDSTAVFAGWAAGAGTDSVPAGVQLVLKGVRDYAVDAATGFPRPDVAKANNHAGWTAAGYAVNADLSAVASGTYTPVLEFSVDGKPMQCATQHKLMVQ